MHTLLPNVEGIGVEVSRLGEVELTLRENGISVPARILSEGTLRMIGLLALSGARDRPSLVGFEEPENGIHPRRIELVADMLNNMAQARETQYVVTTHSPIIPDRVAPESLFVCRMIDGATGIRPFQGMPPLSNRLDIDAALADADETTISERIRRGDYDA